MKIKPKQYTSTFFDNILQGNLFWYDGHLFMKIEWCGGKNAVKLKDGSLSTFLPAVTCNATNGHFQET